MFTLCTKEDKVSCENLVRVIWQPTKNKMLLYYGPYLMKPVELNTDDGIPRQVLTYIKCCWHYCKTVFRYLPFDGVFADHCEDIELCFTAVGLPGAFYADFKENSLRFPTIVGKLNKLLTEECERSDGYYPEANRAGTAFACNW